MIEQTIYGLADPLEPGEIRYVGRTNDAQRRLRFHEFQPMAHDVSARGLWVGYLWYVDRSPVLTVIEQKSFADDEKRESEQWSKQRERFWIRKYRDSGIDLLNREAFWARADRKQVPKNVRTAWEQLHVGLFFADFHASDIQNALQMAKEKAQLVGVQREVRDGTELYDCWDGETHREHYLKWRRIQIQAIEALAAEWPAIIVASVSNLEEMRWSLLDLDGWEARFYPTFSE